MAPTFARKGCVTKSFAADIHEADSVANDIFKNLAVSEVEMALPAEETRSAVVKTIAQFLPAICRMKIVIGGLLRSAIVDETPMSADREE